jgi:hypothetical protein
LSLPFLPPLVVEEREPGGDGQAQAAASRWVHVTATGCGEGTREGMKLGLGRIFQGVGGETFWRGRGVWRSQAG